MKTPSKGLFPVVMIFFLLDQVQKTILQVKVKEEGSQRKKQLHKSPLSLQGEVHPLPNISIEKFLMFLAYTSKDA